MADLEAHGRNPSHPPKEPMPDHPPCNSTGAMQQRSRQMALNPSVRNSVTIDNVHLDPSLEL